MPVHSVRLALEVTMLTYNPNASRPRVLIVDDELIKLDTALGRAAKNLVAEA